MASHVSQTREEVAVVVTVPLYRERLAIQQLHEQDLVLRSPTLALLKQGEIQSERLTGGGHQKAIRSVDGVVLVLVLVRQNGL
jgi:hypothetical protein